MTADFIDFHAAERPEATALIHNGTAISYAAFSRDIAKFTVAARAFGLARGSTVAVGCDDYYCHWLLLLAFERLGIATASFLSGEEPEGCLPLFAAADLVISAPHFPSGPMKRHHAVTHEWLAEIFAGSGAGGEGRGLMRPEDGQRLIRTSGTTAASKLLMISRGMYDGLIDEWIWGFGITSQTRYLTGVSLLVRGGHTFLSACARVGGMAVIGERSQVAQLAASHDATDVILVPLHLQQLVDALPPGYVKPARLKVLSFGAPVPPTLRRRTLERFAAAVCDLYGTVEIATVSTDWGGGAPGHGVIWPGVEVETLGQGGERLPPGQAGLLRIKAPPMAQGYLGDPETTREKFKAGWFYPGDVGVLHPGRRLEVLGRADDLLNIGGIKHWPADLETLILTRAPLADAGVSALPNADGMGEIYVGVVEPRCDDAALVGQIAEALRAKLLGDIRIVKLERIPRNANGKIQRKLLQQALARARENAPGGAR